jgi:hypothetical protein
MWLIMGSRARYNVDRASLIEPFTSKEQAEKALRGKYRGYNYVLMPTDDEPEAPTWNPPGGVGWRTKGKSSQPEVPS